jgi:predicted acyl esterase
VIVTGTGFAPIMRPGVDPHTAPNKPPLPPIDCAAPRGGLVIERNVAIPLRDGVRIYADVYRPKVRAAKPTCGAAVMEPLWQARPVQPGILAAIGRQSGMAFAADAVRRG